MTNYSKGTRFERIAKDELEAKGYVVFRTAGSHGVLDLIAINGNKIRLLQIKSTAFGKKIGDIDWIMRFYNKDLELFNKLVHPLNHSITKELWVWFKSRGWNKYRVEQYGLGLVEED